MSAEPFDPANDPTPGNLLDPDTDFGREPDDILWHRLIVAYGAEATALCGRRFGQMVTATGRKAPGFLCVECAVEHEDQS